MPINDFKTFGAGPGDDVTPQATYAAATWRIEGWTSGILPHEQINKVLRQSSKITSGIAQITADALQEDVLDDSDVTALVNQLRRLFSAGMPYNPASVYAPGSIGYALQTLALGDSLFSAPGAGAVAVSNSSVLAHRLTLAEYSGFDPTGVASSHTAWASAFAALATVYGSPEAFTALKDVLLSHNETFDGCGARVKAASGASDLFVLNGVSSTLKNVYVADNTAVSGAAIAVKGGAYQRIEDVTIVNAGHCGIRLDPGASFSAKGTVISKVVVEDFTGFGLEIRSNVNDSPIDSLYLNGKVDFVLSLGKPRAGSVGWYQNTPVVSGLAVGGHVIDKVTVIGCDEGMHLIDAEYTKFGMVIADSCSSYGVIVDGSSHDVRFDDLFVGTSRGIALFGTAKASINALETRNNGVIPPWGQTGPTGFYNGISTFFDVTLLDSSELTINGENWKGDKRVFVAPTAKLIVTGGDWVVGASRAQLTTSATYYVSQAGALAGAVAANARSAAFRVKRTGRLFYGQAFATHAPGTGLAFTYNIYLSGALVHSVVIANGDFNNHAWANVYCLEGQEGYIEVVAPTGTAASWHEVHLQFLPD